ncbi:RxLR effector protein, partial [Phytophthora megakarya]
MRGLSLVTLLTLLLAASGTPSSEHIGGAKVELKLEGLIRTLPATSQKAKRSLRQYDVNEITKPEFIDGERTFANKV